MSELIYKDECYKIMGACFEVYADKGCGFHEPVYHESLEIEFRLSKIPVVSKPKLSLEYKGYPLSQGYEPDFVCFGKIIPEIKALTHLIDGHRAQVLNYLKASGFELGLLVNFGRYPKLEWERIANSTGCVSALPSQPMEPVYL